jgi:serine/threonine protein kinase
LINIVGQGAYGVVVAAKDKKLDPENNFVAIKKIEKAFEHKIFTKRTLRELRLLRLLKHENIIGINTILLPKSREEFEDMYNLVLFVATLSQSSWRLIWRKL